MGHAAQRLGLRRGRRRTRTRPTSVAEIERRNPHAFDHFHAARAGRPDAERAPHRPQAVDRPGHVPVRARAAGTMRRVPEVIDCWFDSGCMPFAQWGYPAPRAEGEVRGELPGRLHQRGDRPDARLVLLAAHDLDARLRRGARARTRSRRASCSGTSATRRGRRRARARGTTRRRRSSSTRSRWTSRCVDASARTASRRRRAGRRSSAARTSRARPAGGRARSASYRGDAPDARSTSTLQVSKKLPRRVVVLHETIAPTLGVVADVDDGREAGRGPALAARASA